MTWGCLVRTLRPLKTSQVFYRLLYRLRRRLESSRFGWIRRQTLPPPPYGLAVRPNAIALPRIRKPSMTPAARAAEWIDGRLTLLNERLPFLGGDDWQMLGGRDHHRLWFHTLHYHEWLLDWGEGHADLLARYLADWLAVCQPGAPGFTHYPWNSYAIATRLGNWSRLYHGLRPSFWAARPELHGQFLESMALQAAYLDSHLEWDLRANHLLRDALGLAWAGRFFEGREATRWLRRATRLAVDQAAEQVLRDGGHFERSPTYHIQVMEDLLSLALLVKDPAARDALRQTWRRMGYWLACVRHPDGDVPLLNDGGLGAGCEPGRMLELGECLGASIDAAPGQGGRHFPDTGLVAWHGRPWTVFFDVGPVGPDYQPGHGHADTLTVECSYRGRRLFVDPGTYAYDPDPRRRYDRSTRAHNTVAVDGQDSSEVWHVFRVGRRARPLGVSVEMAAGGMTAAASHDGYDPLPGRPRHGRRVIVREGGEFLAVDRVSGEGHHELEGGFLLSPEWGAAATGGGWLLTCGAERVRLKLQGPDGLALFDERRPYHPGYGQEMETTRLGWRFEGCLPIEVKAVCEEA
jgi:uncharacterized heparinase superfamily protein